MGSLECRKIPVVHRIIGAGSFRHFLGSFFCILNDPVNIGICRSRFIQHNRRNIRIEMDLSDVGTARYLVSVIVSIAVTQYFRGCLYIKTGSGRTAKYHLFYLTALCFSDSADQELCRSPDEVNITVAATFHQKVLGCKRRLHVPLLHESLRRNTEIHCTSENIIKVHLTGCIHLFRDHSICICTDRHCKHRAGSHNERHRPRQYPLA